MSEPALRTALVGFGRVAGGYADDPAMARYFPYATHVQVLADHPRFRLCAVADPDPAAREQALSRWRVPIAVDSTAALGALAADIDVVVLATPPQSRLHTLDAFPNVRAVLVEKPLGVTWADGVAFVEACRARNVEVQVNLWRRADRQFRALAAGGLEALVGRVQCVSGMYGNGIVNNGTHMVDFVRMLIGEVETVEVVGDVTAYEAGPIPGDLNPTVAMTLAGGIVATLHPLRFEHYRENGLDIWGTCGRVSIVNEGLTMAHYPSMANRAMTGEREIACDAPRLLESTVGDAFYQMFTNLAEVLGGVGALWSPAESAARSALVVDAIYSALRTGNRIRVSEFRR